MPLKNAESLANFMLNLRDDSNRHLIENVIMDGFFYIFEYGAGTNDSISTNNTPTNTSQQTPSSNQTPTQNPQPPVGTPSTGSPTGTPNYAAVKKPIDNTADYNIADDVGRQADYDAKFIQAKRELLQPAQTMLTTTRTSAEDSYSNLQLAQKSGNQTAIQQANQQLAKDKDSYLKAQSTFVDNDKQFTQKLTDLNTQAKTAEQMAHADEMKKSGMNQPRVQNAPVPTL